MSERDRCGLHACARRHRFVGVGERDRQVAQLGDDLSKRRAACSTSDETNRAERRLGSQRVERVEQSADDAFDRGTSKLFTRHVAA